MLVTGVSLFNNSKNQKNTSLNKDYVSFLAKKPELPEEVGKASKKISDNTKKLLEDYKKLREEGRIRDEDDYEDRRRRPGMPESD